MCNGGFGFDNSISHPTYESILQAAFKSLNIPKEKLRDYKITMLQNENEN